MEKPCDEVVQVLLLENTSSEYFFFEPQLYSSKKKCECSDYYRQYIICNYNIIVTKVLSEASLAI